ncbi:MAG: hypothetical protein J5J04_03315 [Anaerolineae bacterium]|nr:hypothetical protein [Anaerolineae bacterium]MDL1916613.1 hypothetical protein [Anaerolineae bacterium CFX4]RIK20295.1 MAG: hypothetical protein DCC53_10975 [Chloroflexota bacterium]
MGIRLDWESDSASAGKSAYVATEDPALKRKRAAARAKFLLVFTGTAIVFGVLALVVTWRLNEANAYIESLLRDTVEAEFAALRIGDWNAFGSIQRSASEEWLTEQRALFDDVQIEKTKGTVQLDGVIRSVEVDGTRGRVLVDWTRDGVAITQAWFYWRYDDGWRHVPSDLTFWGEPAELRGTLVTIAHRTVDAALAQTMGVRIESWISSTCGPILECGDLPHITLEIRPDFYLTTQWDTQQPWRLLVPSPYVGGASSTEPFSGVLLVNVADAIATRLVAVSLATTQPYDPATDAGYIANAVRQWLVARYAGYEAASSPIASLAAQRGTSALGHMLRALSPDSSLQVILDAMGTTGPNSGEIDWRDLIRYRIVLEATLVARGDPNVSRLYIEEMRSRATEQRIDPSQPVDVRLAQAVTAPDGSPALIASVIVGEGADAREESVYYYWRSGTWLRAS